MRKLIASTMVSLDGVMQAPGGPQEDPTGSFPFGGWTFNYWDEAMGRSMNGLDGKDRELVLGRRTYEIFEAYWPYQPADNPIAQTLNAARKHVASSTLRTLDWNNSTLLRGDVVAAVAALKSEAGPDLQIIGSGNLIQTLQAASLIDEYNLWTFPVVLGRGKRLFEAGAKAGALRLVASRTSATGVVMNTYVPAGEIPPGSFTQAEPSAKELERRAKLETRELHRGRLIDHIGLVVRDLAASKAFYCAVFSALKIPMGGSDERNFWADELFVSTPDSEEVQGELTGRHHLAFQAQDRAMVNAFHQAALAHGGRDNGAPGERPYHPGYYAAFVLDPDGNNIEAVFHGEADRSAASVRITY